MGVAVSYWLARSTTNTCMVYCTDGEFHLDRQCGPGGFCAKLYRTRRGALAVRGGTVTAHACDERGIEL